MSLWICDVAMLIQWHAFLICIGCRPIATRAATTNQYARYAAGTKEYVLSVLSVLSVWDNHASVWDNLEVRQDFKISKFS